MNDKVSNDPLRWWHIEELVSIEVELFGAEAWTEGMFWSELAAGHYYRIAAERERIVGYAGLAIAGEEAWINNIAVRPEARRGGVASMLLSDLLHHARAGGATRVALEVAVDNAPAQRLYDRFGFDGVAVRKGYYQPSNTDAIVMVKELRDE